MAKSDHELIYEYVSAQIKWTVKSANTNYSTMNLAKRCRKLSDELVKRGLLTEEEAESLNG